MGAPGVPAARNESGDNPGTINHKIKKNRLIEKRSINMEGLPVCSVQAQVASPKMLNMEVIVIFFPEGNICSKSVYLFDLANIINDCRTNNDFTGKSIQI